MKQNNNTLKILHLLYESRGDYFGIGGVGARAYEIYKYLKDRHEITLLCKKYPGYKDGEIEGLRHIFVGIESKSLAKTLLSYAYHSAQFVKRHGDEFDVIVEEFSPAIPTFLHAFTEKPVILQVQGYTGTLYFRKYNLCYAIFLFLMEYFRPRLYKNFIFISSETINKLLSMNSSLSLPDMQQAEPLAKAEINSHLFKGGRGVSPPLNIVIIPNGVPSELLYVIPEEGDYILYLGRIDIYGKGLDTLISAYKEFYKSFSHIRLVIAGDGRDMGSFKAMLVKLNDDIRRNIELAGWVSGAIKTEIIRKALFCIFPSRHEVQPIAAIEAMSCGKAVIVSDISEFCFVVQNKAGLSFKSGDTSSLARSMKDMITNDERKEMGMRGRDLVKDFTWDRIAQKFEGFLQTLEKEKG